MRKVTISLSPSEFAALEAKAKAFDVSTAKLATRYVRAALEVDARPLEKTGCVSCNQFWRRDNSEDECKKFGCGCGCHIAALAEG